MLLIMYYSYQTFIYYANYFFTIGPFDLRNTSISKCSSDNKVRRGDNTLLPRENNLSTAALDGKPVLRDMNKF